MESPLEPEKSKTASSASAVWSNVNERADKLNDPNSLALLDLKRGIEDDRDRLKKESCDFVRLLNEYKDELGQDRDEYKEGFKKQEKEFNNNKSELRKINNFLIGCVIVVSIAFVTTIVIISVDAITDKSLYLNYNNMYERYSNNSEELRNQFFEQELQVNNLLYQIQILKAKNPYLK